MRNISIKEVHCKDIKLKYTNTTWNRSINLYKKIFNNNIDEVDDELEEDMEYVETDTYNKYMKYKSKYIKLKNKLINFI